MEPKAAFVNTTFHSSKKFTHNSCDKITAGWLGSSWLLQKARPERLKGIQIRVQGKGGRTQKQYMF